MKFICACAVLAAVIASPVYADCPQPQDPGHLPDGNTATLQDMLTTQKAVAAYNDATNSYLDCLKKEHDAAIQAAGPQISSKERDKIDRAEVTKHNAAVDQLNKTAGNFNEQVRLFKAAHAAPPAKGSAAKPSSG